MRGLIGFGCLALSLASAATSLHPTEQDRADTYRLLALEGRAAVRWNLPRGGLPARITYAFITEPVSFPGARNCDGMEPPAPALARSNIEMKDFRREVREAFDLWEDVANVSFQEVSSAAGAGILIGADAKPRGRAFTNVALKSDGAGRAGGMGDIRQSLICFNPEQPWKIGFDGDLKVYDLRFTMAHEIGHAIGLDHPGPEGQLMSFRYKELSRELQPGDIAGAAALYGQKGKAAAAPSLPSATASSPSAASPRPASLGLSEASPR